MRQDPSTGPSSIIVEPLALHPEALPTLMRWYEAEWPAWYRSGRGNARRDLESYSNQDSLPAGLVALRAAKVCGVAVLKAESIASHVHLTPWAAAGFVDPALRGQGIGLLLLNALEENAQGLGFSHIYCATGTSASLLVRAHWQLIEQIDHEGEMLSIYEKPL